MFYVFHSFHFSRFLDADFRYPQCITVHCAPGLRCSTRFPIAEFMTSHEWTVLTAGSRQIPSPLQPRTEYNSLPQKIHFCMRRVMTK